MEQEIGTLYDINKNLSVADAPLKKHEIKDKLRQLMTPFVKNIQDRYFMLLCRERYDFTLFNYITKTDSSVKQSLKDMFECLTNRGEVISIEMTENNDAIEMWLRIEGEVFCFYFFPYELGVIEVNNEENYRSASAV